MALLTDSAWIDTVLLTSIVIFLIYKYFTSSFNYWKDRGIEYLKPIPFFGNFKDVATLKTPIGHLLADFYNQTTADFFGIWVFGTPHHLIRNPDIVKNILVRDFNHFSDRTIVSDEKADPIASKVLFMLKNPEWKRMRTKLSPMFTSGKIRLMIPLMNAAAEEMKCHLNKTAAARQQSIEMKEICSKLTTDIITSCAFGVNAESFRHDNAAFREIGRKMFDYNMKNAFRQTSYFFAPAIVSALGLTFFDPDVNKFCKRAILDTIAERERSGIKRNDVIDIIIDLKKNGHFDGIDKQEENIVAQGLQFFAAGFETTSSTISFTLYEMCLNPTIQTKLRREINATIGEDGNVTYENIQSMKYLDKVVKETLRKYPVLPFLDRRCLSNYRIPGTDKVIEKGTPVYIPMWGLHYDPKYFPEPEKFDPERFSEESEKTRPSYAYIPFGDGPHNCIGERFGLIASKLGIIHILSAYCVEPCDQTPIPIVFDPKSFVLQSTVGLPMRLTEYNRRMSAAG